MVQQPDQEPTMEEIVVALRETHRSAGRPAPSHRAGRPPGNSGKAPNVVSYPRDWIAGTTSAAELRDAETERLLAENARLNERVVFLLKVIEFEQARSAERAAMLREVKGALLAELRPGLLMLLRSLEKQNTDPDKAAATGDMPSAWIVDPMNKLEANNQTDWLHEPLLLPQSGPTLRQRLSRFFHAMGFLSSPVQALQSGPVSAALVRSPNQPIVFPAPDQETSSWRPQITRHAPSKDSTLGRAESCLPH